MWKHCVSMIQKNHLVKQFELLTQQEIKNYQDSLNFVLQSINELKDSIEEIRQNSLENYAAIHSVQVHMGIELEHIKNNLENINQRVDRNCNDQKSVNEKNNFEINNIKNEISLKVSRDNNFEKKLIHISTTIDRVKEISDKNRNSLGEISDNILRKFSNDLIKTKNEILNSPSEASLVKKILEEKIDSHKVDVAGIMRELMIYKKENVVTEKKIENIYTLIDRLKKSEA